MLLQRGLVLSDSTTVWRQVRHICPFSNIRSTLTRPAALQSTTYRHREIDVDFFYASQSPLCSFLLWNSITLARFYSSLPACYFPHPCCSARAILKNMWSPSHWFVSETEKGIDRKTWLIDIGWEWMELSWGKWTSAGFGCHLWCRNAQNNQICLPFTVLLFVFSLTWLCSAKWTEVYWIFPLILPILSQDR